MAKISAKNKIPQALSQGGEAFALHCRAKKLKVETEYVFHPTRKWRFDFAFPTLKLAVEIEGVRRGLGGRHQQTEGMAKDMEKYNAAVKMGWMVLRYTSRMVERGDAINDVLELLG
jgi:very-short-patch-repair endonuclease